MNDQTIKAIVEELAPALINRMMGKVFQLSRLALAVDFRTNDGRYLFISVEPSRPRIYMIERRVRELEKQALSSSSFALVLKKQLAGARLTSLFKEQADRIVRFLFNGTDEIGNRFERTMVAQLTGKAANILLLDEQGFIIDTLRPPRGEGQEVGNLYLPPPLHERETPTTLSFEKGSFATLSEAADEYYRNLERAGLFDSRAAAARARLQKEITQRTKLRSHLDKDLEGHGDADEHKRIGDLLLANIGREKRRGNKVALTDYFTEEMPQIELELDENSTLQEEAARRFSRYTKARRAVQEITQRRSTLEQELAMLLERRSELESIIAARDEAALESFWGEAQRQTPGERVRPKTAESIPGTRRYRSSDGYEILVGRAARVNDYLTFRVARPYDLWLHAADYPGSHVVIRNPTRADIPHRTIIEAAQLAAAFSQARRDAKVDVHYTQRKFLSKPRGAAPGLVRMSSFRSLTVQPIEAIERI